MERDDDLMLMRAAIPPNPWFAQRIINNAMAAERPVPFWRALWRDFNTSFPVPKPALALVMAMVFGLVVGLSTQGSDIASPAPVLANSVLYETGGIL